MITIDRNSTMPNIDLFKTIFVCYTVLMQNYATNPSNNQSMELKIIRLNHNWVVSNKRQIKIVFNYLTKWIKILIDRKSLLLG